MNSLCRSRSLTPFSCFSFLIIFCIPPPSGSHRNVQRGSEAQVGLHRCLQEPGAGVQVLLKRLHLEVYMVIWYVCVHMNIYIYTVYVYISHLLHSPSLCRELGDFEAAMESFQKALMLNQNHIQSLQLRGMMLYHHGSLREAIGNFKVWWQPPSVACIQVIVGMHWHTDCGHHTIRVNSVRCLNIGLMSGSPPLSVVWPCKQLSKQYVCAVPNVLRPN